MVVSVVRSHGIVCSQITWSCMWPEHVVLSVARTRGVVCRQITWCRMWLDCVALSVVKSPGTKYVPYRPRKCVQYVQRIMCLEVPKNTRYKAFKNLNSSFIIDATLNMRLLPHTKKNKKKKYFLHTCYLSSAGFEPARSILGETLQAGKPYVVPLHQAGAVIMTPSPFLNTRLKDFKMCDRINYIYLRNGRKFPHLSNSPAGPVDPTIAFQPGDPSSIPARGFHNW